MSKLLNPGAGEIVDRLQILALKVCYGKERGKPTAHFEREMTGLLTKLAGRTLNGAWFAPTVLLGAVHAALWHKTDELRALGYEIDQTQGVEGSSRATLLADAGRIGLQIMQLNDSRADYVRAINELAGEAADGPEKL